MYAQTEEFYLTPIFPCSYMCSSTMGRVQILISSKKKIVLNDKVTYNAQ